jgi:hypothetical protein
MENSEPTNLCIGTSPFNQSLMDLREKFNVKY